MLRVTQSKRYKASAVDTDLVQYSRAPLQCEEAQRVSGVQQHVSDTLVTLGAVITSSRGRESMF